MDNIITLTCGDWSHDGHSRTSSGTIRTNLTQKEIVKAYEKGAKIIGVDISEDLGFIEEYCGIQNNIGYLGVTIQDLSWEPELGRVPTEAQKQDVMNLWASLPDEARKIIGEPRFLFTMRYG